MEGKVNYTAVGVFVVVLGCLFTGIVFWLSSVDHEKMYHGYLVYMHEDVGGLSEESPVRFNGVKVGYVESIHLDANNSKLVKLVLRVEPGVPITTTTYAVLVPQGVTGVVTVNLNATTETAPPLLKQPGQPYPIIPARPSLLRQVSTILPGVAADFQKLSAHVAELLNQKNLDLIHQSLQNIATVSDQFPKLAEQMNETLVSINTLSKNATQTSTSIDQTMKSGQQVIHAFSTQLMPSTQQTLANLANITQNVNQLTEEMKQNPSILIRGKQPAAPGPGEK